MSKKNITNDEVKHIAKLSKLNVTEDELDYYAKEMDKILEFFKTLSKVDTSNIKEMTHVSNIGNITRDDKVEKGINGKDFLKNSSGSFGNYIKVPKILDKG